MGTCNCRFCICLGLTLVSCSFACLPSTSKSDKVAVNIMVMMSTVLLHHKYGEEESVRLGQNATYRLK